MIPLHSRHPTRQQPARASSGGCRSDRSALTARHLATRDVALVFGAWRGFAQPGYSRCVIGSDSDCAPTRCCLRGRATADLAVLRGCQCPAFARANKDCRARGGARSRIGCRLSSGVLAHERRSSARLLASGSDGGIGRVRSGHQPDMPAYIAARGSASSWARSSRWSARLVTVHRGPAAVQPARPHPRAGIAAHGRRV